jgi:hypothetical protein
MLGLPRPSVPAFTAAPEYVESLSTIQEYDMRIRLIDVRLAFPSLWKATAPRGGGEEAFSASFLMPPTHRQIAEINAAFVQLANEKWGAKGPAILKALRSADKVCLHNGDAKADYDGFPGNLYVSARSKVKPTTFDGQRNEVSESSGIIYSGCYVNASLELWAQENSYGKRINAQLRGVQFLRKGDAFAGGSSPASADDFDEISAEGTEGDESPDVDLTA